MTLLATVLNREVTDSFELERCNERVDIIRHKLKFLENKPVVACITSLEPLTLADELVTEMLAVAGGISIAAGDGRSTQPTWEYISSVDPDIIILMLEGFSLDKSLKVLGQLLVIPGFTNLKAIKNNRLYITDGNQYFNRPGPRIVDSMEILAEIINPKQFIFGYEGEGWMKFQV